MKTFDLKAYRNRRDGKRSKPVPSLSFTGYLPADLRLRVSELLAQARERQLELWEPVSVAGE
jgi:hypothetical protein